MFYINESNVIWSKDIENVPLRHGGCIFHTVTLLVLSLIVNFFLCEVYERTQVDLIFIHLLCKNVGFLFFTSLLFHFYVMATLKLFVLCVPDHSDKSKVCVQIEGTKQEDEDEEEDEDDEDEEHNEESESEDESDESSSEEDSGSEDERKTDAERRRERALARIQVCCLCSRVSVKLDIT